MKPSIPQRALSFKTQNKDFTGFHWLLTGHLVSVAVLNIASGKTSQAINPYNFSNYFGFYHFCN